MNIPPGLLSQIPTPSLVVDRAAATRNIASMASYLAGTPTRLRPHFKAHKSTSLLRLQLEAGSCSGVTCATAQEALVVARAGFEDVLIANEVVDQFELTALAEAARFAHLTAAVDDPAHVALLEQAALRADVRFDVLVDIDVGMHRAGLQPGHPMIIELAGRVAAADRLNYRGILAYDGHAQLELDAAVRRRLSEHASRLAARARDDLAHEGYAPQLLSGAGTGTFQFAAEQGVLNEIQAGSYVLMDAAYAAVNELPFENALFCLARVVSVPASDRAVLNAGLKALSAEKGPPHTMTPGTRVAKVSDEHAVLIAQSGSTPRIGDVVVLVPSHIDPTINLHDVLFVWDEETQAIGQWPVDGRRHYA